MGCESIVKVFFHITTTIKLYHWQTTNFARHKATDSLHGALSELIDTFVEAFMGKYGRSKANVNYTVELDNLGDDFISVIDSFIEYLYSLNNDLQSENDSELLNIRDEMLGALNQLMYLLSLS